MTAWYDRRMGTVRVDSVYATFELENIKAMNLLGPTVAPVVLIEQHLIGATALTHPFVTTEGQPLVAGVPPLSKYAAPATSITVATTTAKRKGAAHAGPGAAPPWAEGEREALESERNKSAGLRSYSIRHVYDSLLRPHSVNINPYKKPQSNEVRKKVNLLCSAAGLG